MFRKNCKRDVKMTFYSIKSIWVFRKQVNFHVQFENVIDFESFVHLEDL